MSMSEIFSVPFLTLIKLSYTKALEWSSLVPGPEATSSSEITNPTSFAITYHFLLHLLHWQLDYLPLTQWESLNIYMHIYICMYIYRCIYFFLFLTASGLINSWGMWDLPHPSCCLFVLVLRLLSICGMWAPEHRGPVAVVCGLSCPAA